MFENWIWFFSGFGFGWVFCLLFSMLWSEGQGYEEG